MKFLDRKALRFVQKNSPVTAKEVSRYIRRCIRTTRDILDRLVEQGLIKKMKDIFNEKGDARTNIYYAKGNRVYRGDSSDASLVSAGASPAGPTTPMKNSQSEDASVMTFLSFEK